MCVYVSVHVQFCLVVVCQGYFLPLVLQSLVHFMYLLEETKIRHCSLLIPDTVSCVDTPSTTMFTQGR